MNVPRETSARHFAREKRRILFLSLLIMLAFFRWIPGGATLDPTTSVRGYLEAGILVLAFAVAMAWWRRHLFKAFVLGWWLMLPSFWAMLSALWSPMPLITLVKGGELFLLNLLALLFASSVLSFADWMGVLNRVLLVVLVLGLGLNVAYYGTPFYFGMPYGETFATETTRSRFTLAADHPLVVGHIFALLLLTFVPGVTRFWGILGSAVGFAGLFATQARASIVMTLVALAWTWFILLRKKYKWSGLIMQTILFFLGLMSLPWLVSVGLEVASTYAPDVDTLNNRIPLWILTMEELLSDTWLFLLGTGLEATRFITFDLMFWNPGHTHNGYLEILASLGLIGLLFYTPVFAFLFRQLFNENAGRFVLYLLGMAFFNPVFNPGFLWFFVLVAAFIGEKEGENAHLQTPHPLPAAGR